MSFQITPLTVSIREGRAEQASPSAEQLDAARIAYAARSDSFAEGKAAICGDLAAKLRRFGSYASPKQQEFAAKLVAWARIDRNVSNARPNLHKLLVPSLFDVMQRHTTFHAGDFKLQRKNQDSLVWIVDNDVCIGKIENATVTLFTKRIAFPERVIALLREFDADPLAAAMKYGKLSGRCCSCGRDLTDPESIERGIGPVCAQKFA